jgi:hypothetical protein
LKKLASFIVLAFVINVFLPTQQASALNNPPTGRFAYFWGQPQDGTGAPAIAALNNYLVFTHGNESFRDSVKQAGYTGLAFQYLLAAEVDGPGPYADSTAKCDSTFQPWSNQIAMDAGSFCTFLHPNESYFLHNSNGQRLYILDGNHVRYQMNPAAAGWRNFFVTRALREFQGAPNYAARGFDGLFLDDVWVDLYSLNHQKTNSTGATRNTRATMRTGAPWPDSSAS